MVFDPALPWVILVPPGSRAARTLGEELARGIGALRGSAEKRALPLVDAAGPAPGEGVPIIALNPGDGAAAWNGFSWRAAPERVEIYGDSGRGLCNGTADFLAALGFCWEGPGKERLPVRGAGGLVELKTKGAHAPSKAGAAGRRRLVLSGEDILCRGEEAARWAALNQIDALVLPFREGGSVLARLRGLPRRARQRLLLAAERYELIIEAGGWDLSFFVPRRYFWIRRELFRMVSGKRRRDLNFCPTNPDTIALLKVRAEKFFRAWPGVEVFHLWPGRSSGSPWCSCPSCRAFSPREQNRVAVNAAADVLLGINPAALVSFYEEAAGEGEGGTIPLRPNLFALEKLPGDEGAAGEGLFSLPPETAPGKHR